MHKWILAMVYLCTKFEVPMFSCSKSGKNDPDFINRHGFGWLGCLQCFDAVGWVAGRASGLACKKWGMVKVGTG